ncbi:MAG: helix-turn-helix transcriptional regulator [Polyangia bacterium]
MVQGRKNPAHVDFPKRLKKARQHRELSSAALSLQAGLSLNAAYGLESGERIPRIDTIERLARALQISPCALAFGVEAAHGPATGLLCDGLPARLAEARAERGLSRNGLGQLSNTSDTLVRMTETGATVPTLEKLDALARALRVSPCWLAFGLGPMEAPSRRRTRAAAVPPGAL